MGEAQHALKIDPEALLEVYRMGLFPMARSVDDPMLELVDPDWRGVLPLDSFRTPRRLQRLVRSGHFEIRFDTDFEAVIRNCAQVSQNRPETWINELIITAFLELHRMGHAHSVEAWSDGCLVGGLYGLAQRGAFFGESMFSRQSNASKVALVHLVAQLKLAGFSLLDAQFHNDHLEQFGLVEMPRSHFLIHLNQALERECVFPGRQLAALEVSQATTQAS